MTKLGTPSGAAPNWAMVSPAFALVGEPSGARSAGSSIFLRSALLTPLPPFGAFLPKMPSPGAAGAFFVPPVLGVPLPPRRAVGAPARRGPSGRRRRALGVVGAGVGGRRRVVLVGVERAAAARVGQVDGAVAVVVGEVGARGQRAAGRDLDLRAAQVDVDGGRRPCCQDGECAAQRDG